VLLGILLPGSLLLHGSPWLGNASLHNTMESVATTLAAVVGALALVRFYTRKRSTFLYIATGFLGTAVLDGYHLLVTSSFFPNLWDAELRDLEGWTWIASRLFLSLFLFVSWLAWRQEAKDPKAQRANERSVYMTSATMTLLILAFFAVAPVVPAYRPDAWISRPGDLLPGLFFVMALAGFLRKGDWRHSAFEHWLVIALILSALQQTVYMPFSRELYDAFLDAGHFLKVMSYVAVLVGLLASVFVTFRREEAAYTGVRWANEALAREVEVRRRAEEELAASQANLSALFESTGDAIWSVDRAGRLITFNSAYELLVEVVTGREPEEGDLPEAVAWAGDASWFMDACARALSGARFSEVRQCFLGTEERFFELYFNPIQSSMGTAGAVVFSKDITRRIRAEEDLRGAMEDAEEASQAKSRFLASMSHELRTPLNSVIGFANVLLKDRHGTLTHQDKSFLERILANGKHLLTLINQVLDLSKIEAGRMELELSAVDLEALVRSTLSQLEGEVRGRPIRLEAELPPRLEAFRTDEGKLRQVLINLVGNALKFTAEGRIVVRVTTNGPPGTPRRIEVCDTGIGIPLDRLDAIFDAFQQAEQGTSRRFGGTGLGLSISRSLCTLLGYRLTAESELGKGSTFSIHLAPDPSGDRVLAGSRVPARPEPAGEVVEMARGAAGDRTILVIDDQEEARALMEHYLHAVGCRVLSAATGEEGLAVARAEKPDLVTLDLLMPEMSGWEVLRSMKGDPELRDIPVVVVSVLAGEGKGRFWGAADLLEKPVDPEALLRAITRNLGATRGRILVVEDDPDARTLLRRFLWGEAVEVWEARNGGEALALLPRASPDLILLDLMMPVMDGTSFLQVLRRDRKFRNTPVIVLTGKDLHPEEASSLRNAGAVLTMKGEGISPQLQRLVRTVLEHRRDPVVPGPPG